MEKVHPVRRDNSYFKKSFFLGDVANSEPCYGDDIVRGDGKLGLICLGKRTRRTHYLYQFGY